MSYGVIYPSTPAGSTIEVGSMHAGPTSAEFVGSVLLPNGGGSEGCSFDEGCLPLATGAQGGVAEPTAISTRLYSAGAILRSGIDHPVMWTPSAKISALLPLPSGAQSGTATAIDSREDTAGDVKIKTPDGTYDGTEAVYWPATGGETILTSLGGYQDSAMAMNDAEICGVSDGEAVVWSTAKFSAGSIIWSDNSAQQSQAQAINANGDACGQDGGNAAYWSPTGAETVLANPSGQTSDAVSINPTGETCGYSGSDAVRWNSAGGATVLSASNAQADSINAHGATVGSAAGDAMYWSPTGAATDLGKTMGSAWSSTNATSIDSHGDVDGYGIYNGMEESFILIAPRPAAGVTRFAESHIHHVLSVSSLAVHT